MSKPLFLLMPLLSITSVQAAPYDPPAHGEGSVVFTPAARPRFSNLDPQPSGNLDIRNEPRNNSRYGIGYDARHGIDVNTRNPSGPGMNAIQPMLPPAQIERAGGAGRGGKGR
ncbi:MAG: hypothetical protein Q7U80_15170 [Thiobacillus sp.]|nr:hypothetical protein [Thiobacillus sp.]